LKDAPRDRLIAAVTEIIAGKTSVDATITGKLFAHVSASCPEPATQSSKP
jgi:DNA-binding NarL/FixJ family response regulator